MPFRPTRSASPALASLLTSAVLCVLFGPSVHAEDSTPPETDTLDKVVVTATRQARDQQEVAASVSVQDKQALDRKGFYAGGDEFRGVPGVFLRRGQGDNEDILTINFRGIIGNHGNDTFLALFDGLSFLSSDDELLMQELPYAAVDRVEIVRGPVSALYGRGGLAGAVNYISLDPGSDASHVSLRFGSDNYRRTRVLFTHEADSGAGVVVSASHEKADGWRDNNARETSQLFAKGVLPLGETLDLTLYGSWMDRRYQTGGGIPTLADGSLFDLGLGREGYYGLPASGQDLTAWFGAARLSWQVNDRLDWTTSLMQRHRRFDTNQSFYDAYLFDPDNHLLGVNGFVSKGDESISFLDSVMSWRGDRHTLTAGASHERGRPRINTGWSGQNGFTLQCGFQWYANLFDTRTGAWVNRDHPCQTTNITAITRGTTRFTAVFVQDEVALGEHWRLTLGARYDRFERSVDMLPTDGVTYPRREQNSDSHVSPKATLSHALGNGQLYAAYGEGYSSNFGPVWQWDPAAYHRDTKPSTLDSLELGYKAGFLGGRLQLAAALFSMEQKNRTFNVDNPASWDDPTLPGTLVLSGPPLKSRGAELSLSAQLGEATRLAATASFVDAEWGASDFYTRYPALPDLAGRTPVGVPDTMWSLHLDHRFSTWLSGRVGYEWYDDYFVSLDNRRKGGGYALGNLSLTLTPPSMPRFTADLIVSNLFDRDYNYLFGGATDVSFAVPGVPRQLWVDLRYAF